MVADGAKAVLFIEPLCPRIKFPNAEPHHVVTVRLSDGKAFIQKRLADALSQKTLVRIKPRKFYRPLRRYARFDRTGYQLCISGRFAFVFSDQKYIAFVRKLRPDLIFVERLPHIIGKIIRRILRMMRERIPKRLIRKLREESEIFGRSFSDNGQIRHVIKNYRRQKPSLP